MGGGAGELRHLHRRECVDYSGYPDRRPEYIEAYERMANLATRAEWRAAAPSRSTLR